jgi:hypothetical protein
MAGKTKNYSSEVSLPVFLLRLVLYLVTRRNSPRHFFSFIAFETFGFDFHFLLIKQRGRYAFIAAARSRVSGRSGEIGQSV